ncbi:MAG: hypothetical protein AAF567_02730 [Actinomycetota bacterium]
MTSVVCPHCGQPVVVDAGSQSSAASGDDGTAALPIIPDISGGPGAAHNGSPGQSADMSLPAGARRGGDFGGRWLPLIAVGLLGVIAALVAIVAFRGGDETADADPVGDGDPSADTDATSGIEPSGDPNFPPSDDHLASDAVAEFFRDWSDDLGSVSVVYPSPMGLQVLSGFGVTNPRIEVATGFQQAASLPLMSDGNTSWAVDPENLDRIYLVSTQFVVVDIDRDGRVGFINDSIDPPNIGESSFGAWGPGFDLPPGAEVIAVPRRGLFVLPSVGGTYLYGANAVAPFSEDVLIAASIDSEIFERCDAALACELYVTTPSQPEGQVLEIDARSDIWVSPEGRWVIWTDPEGVSTMLEMATGEQIAVPDRVRAVDWSDDGHVAALLANEQLFLFRPDSGEIGAITLPVAPSAGSVLLVEA